MPDLTRSFNDARVWITGASTGIGAALVKAFAARGARVAITARRRELLEQIAKTYGGPDGSRVLVVPADVTDRDAVAVAARTIRGAWGAIDLAIFNAGGVIEGDFVKTMALNYSSVVYGVEAVVNSMLARGREPGGIPPGSDQARVRRVEGGGHLPDGRTAIRAGAEGGQRHGDQPRVRAHAAHRSEHVHDAVSRRSRRCGGADCAGPGARKE